MRKSGIDLLDQMDELLLCDEDQGLRRVVKRPDVVPVIVSGDQEDMTAEGRKIRALLNRELINECKLLGEVWPVSGQIS